MTATQRRSGFLGKWTADDQPPEEEQRAETDMPEPADTSTVEQTVDPIAGVEPGVEPSDQFLSSLTAAMRRVADDARESSLADARAAIAAKIAAMRATATARSDELRTRAEADVTGIGEWSRAEIVRIEAETQRKVEQRRAQLAEQLDEHDRRSSADIAALESQVEQYEGELALFFSQLGEITDPDTFISAARRMPRLPQPEAEPEADAAVAGDASPAEHEDRLRTLGIDRNGDTDMAEGDAAPTNGTHADADGAPSTADAEAPVTPDDPTPAQPFAEPPPIVADATLDTTTTIAAVGLGSFGAVTAFKSALEKAEGVTAVRLSLGSGGEFVYTVTHRADLDLGDVSAAALPGATVERSADGVLQLSAGKHR
ncbi:MAG TPA: hypothetical protein VGO32_02630 [Candidatus Limnocylindria bacterium]|jgi:hypothetical protein|nr:hypothetical protein [Candidatus Limnocylindria bacterium]